MRSLYKSWGSGSNSALQNKGEKRVNRKHDDILGTHSFHQPTHCYRLKIVVSVGDNYVAKDLYCNNSSFGDPSDGWGVGGITCIEG